jgi:phosphoglycerate dehydrogenase-like enzyme
VARPVAVLLDLHEPAVRAVIAAECPATVELRMATSADPGDRTALARDAAFFVGGITPIPASLMDAAPALRLIHKWGIGVDKIDLAAARARGIPVAITAGANAVAVAEFTLLLMLAVLRRLPYREAQLRSGEWNRARGETRLEARQLRGKLVGLVGLGAIGRQVAKRLQAFDAEVRYFDIRRPTPAEEQALGVRFQALDGLLSEVDIVSLHVPYTPATRRMLSRERIARLRPGAIVINTARGEVVDEAALAEALVSGRLGGAGLDVFAGEPPGADHPLLGVRVPGLVLAPHVAGSVFDNVATVARHVFRNIQRVLDGQPLPAADLVSLETGD